MTLCCLLVCVSLPQHHVFDQVMRQQVTKLQASGVDLGSNLMFGVRLGFSGTPSDLLPTELR